MDPLSIIAGIAGISQAGASLSVAIFRMISAAKSAPKEVSDIARGVSDLSMILRELRRVLGEGRQIYRRKLIRRVGVAMRRIGKIHEEIEELLELENDFSRLKWAFRRSKATQLLYQVESHKTGVHLILQTMILASQLKMHSSQHQDSKEDKEETTLLRKQAENLVQVSYQSLRSLVTKDENGFPEGYSPDETNHQDEDVAEQSSENKLQLYKAGLNDTATWLFELAFPTITEVSTLQALVRAEPNKVDDGHQSRALTRTPPSRLVPQSTQPIEEFLQAPIHADLTLHELLSEWTTLTEDEIEGVEKKPKKENNDTPTESVKSEDQKKVPEGPWDMEIIEFKDAVGRKFIFPFELAQTWPGMEELIQQCFRHVEIIGPHVADGHYDLVAEEGHIIIPQCWEKMIRAGANITMHMWPLPEPKELSPPRPPPPSGPLPGPWPPGRRDYGPPVNGPPNNGHPVIVLGGQGSQKVRKGSKR